MPPERTQLLVEKSTPGTLNNRKSEKRLSRRARRRLEKLRAAKRAKFAPLGPTKPKEISKELRRSKLTRAGILADPGKDQPKRARSTFTRSGALRIKSGRPKSLFARRNRDPLDPLGGPRSLFI